MFRCHDETPVVVVVVVVVSLERIALVFHSCRWKTCVCTTNFTVSFFISDGQTDKQQYYTPKDLQTLSNHQH